MTASASECQASKESKNPSNERPQSSVILTHEQVPRNPKETQFSFHISSGLQNEGTL